MLGESAIVEWDESKVGLCLSLRVGKEESRKKMTRWSARNSLFTARFILYIDNGNLEVNESQGDAVKLERMTVRLIFDIVVES